MSCLTPAVERRQHEPAQLSRHHVPRVRDGHVESLLARCERKSQDRKEQSTEPAIAARLQLWMTLPPSGARSKLSPGARTLWPDRTRFEADLINGSARYGRRRGAVALLRVRPSRILRAAAGPGSGTDYPTVERQSFTGFPQVVVGGTAIDSLYLVGGGRTAERPH